MSRGFIWLTWVSILAAIAAAVLGLAVLRLNRMLRRVVTGPATTRAEPGAWELDYLAGLDAARTTNA